MRNFLIIIFLFFSWFSFAQVTPSVTIFTNYNYNNSPDSSMFADNYRGFQLERAYFADNNNLHSEKFYRYMNEIPTIMLIIVITLVVFKF